MNAFDFPDLPQPPSREEEYRAYREWDTALYTEEYGERCIRHVPYSVGTQCSFCGCLHRRRLEP